jgi:hypothetical protein
MEKSLDLLDLLDNPWMTRRALRFNAFWLQNWEKLAHDVIVIPS